jgi:hypothetical protein
MATAVADRPEGIGKNAINRGRQSVLATPEKGITDWICAPNRCCSRDPGNQLLAIDKKKK